MKRKNLINMIRIWIALCIVGMMLPVSVFAEGEDVRTETVEVHADERNETEEVGDIDTSDGDWDNGLNVSASEEHTAEVTVENINASGDGINAESNNGTVDVDVSGNITADGYGIIAESTNDGTTGIDVQGEITSNSSGVYAQ
jgi:hypothetical protein